MGTITDCYDYGTDVATNTFAQPGRCTVDGAHKLDRAQSWPYPSREHDGLHAKTEQKTTDPWHHHGPQPALKGNLYNSIRKPKP